MSHLENNFIADMQLLESVFDIDQIISEDLSLFDTEQYYAQSNLGYTLMHSFEGALHMALSDSEKFTQKDYLTQVRYIAQHIDNKNAYKILELGSGKGFNIYHLLNLLPHHVKIYGLDYSRLHVQKSHERLQDNILRADFHYIPFANNSFDYIYEIESICHATQITKVLHNAYRVLKSGGVFTIYDGFRIIPSNQLNDMHLRARHLVEKPLGVDKGTLLDDFIAQSIAVGFTVTKKENFSKKIMPNLNRLRKLQKWFIPNKLLLQLAVRTMPKYFVRNSIAAILMPYMVQSGYQGYFKIELSKE